MKNRAKKIIAVSLGVCFWALWFAFFLFLTKPYTEKIVIWLPDNYELENNVKNEVVSIMPIGVNDSYPCGFFYSEVRMNAFKKLFENSKRQVLIQIKEAGYSNSLHYYYQIIYKMKCFDLNKSFFVVAKEDHNYKKRTLSEMILRGRDLFLKNNRDTNLMYTFSILGLVVIATIVSLYWSGLNMTSKQSNN